MSILRSSSSAREAGRGCLEGVAFAEKNDVSRDVEDDAALEGVVSLPATVGRLLRDAGDEV